MANNSQEIRYAICSFNVEYWKHVDASPARSIGSRGIFLEHERITSAKVNDKGGCVRDTPLSREGGVADVVLGYQRAY